jgi:precorrin-3B methylase
MNRLLVHLIPCLCCVNAAAPAHAAPVHEAHSSVVDSASLASSDLLSPARQIRARKLVRRFVDREMTLVLRNGDVKVGKLRTLHHNRFVLYQEDSGDTLLVQTREVDRIILRAGMTEILLSSVTALGVGALAAGVLALTGSADAAGAVIAGGFGSAVGGSLGWRTFYRDTTIRLE